MKPEYYIVKNWERFQHYKDRSPPWIKLHFELLASKDWVMLADASRLLMVVCMMVASRNEGKIPADPHYLKRVAYLDKLPNLTPLLNCGFIINPLADASTLQADARPEKRQRREETEERSISPPYPPLFETLWKIYPRKDGSKAKAFEFYQKAISEGVDHARIESGVRAYADYVAGEGVERQHIAHAATWLNQRRWEGDYSGTGKPRSEKQRAVSAYADIVAKRNEAARLPGGAEPANDVAGAVLPDAEGLRREG